MYLEVPLTLEPMEAEAVDTLPPSRTGWQYEPKVDGFRCIIFRDGDQVHLQSRRQKPLKRYFPEVAEAARTIEPARFVLDGELVIPGQPFDALQLRLHPAASRIRKLAAEYLRSLSPSIFSPTRTDIRFSNAISASGERRWKRCFDRLDGTRRSYCRRQRIRLSRLAPG
jgi:hypothetical protein